MTNPTNPNQKTDRVHLTTPKFRVSFPAVFEPKLNNLNPSAKAKYGVTMLFNTKDPEVLPGLEAMKKAVMDIIVSKFGADQTKWPRKPGTNEFAFRLPFRSGAEKDLAGYGPDVVFINATSEKKPGIVYSWAGEDNRPAPLTEPNEFYGGCFARATVNPYWYDKAGNRGVAFGLGNLQKLGDGDPFGGGKSAENDFDAIPNPGAAKAAPAGGGEKAAGFPF